MRSRRRSRIETKRTPPKAKDTTLFFQPYWENFSFGNVNFEGYGFLKGETAQFLLDEQSSYRQPFRSAKRIKQCYLLRTSRSDAWPFPSKQVQVAGPTGHCRKYVNQVQFFFSFSEQRLYKIEIGQSSDTVHRKHHYTGGC